MSRAYVEVRSYNYGGSRTSVHDYIVPLWRGPLSELKQAIRHLPGTNSSKEGLLYALQRPPRVGRTVHLHVPLSRGGYGLVVRGLRADEARALTGEDRLGHRPRR